MPSMQLRRDDVIVGVDTHKDNHVAVAIDGLGGRLGDVIVPTTIAGFEELLAFCLAFVGSAGRLVGFGIEGTGSYGVGLARYLRNHGHQVHEIPAPRGPWSGVSQARTTPSTPSTLHGNCSLATACRHRRRPTALWRRSDSSRSHTTAPFRRAPRP